MDSISIWNDYYNKTNKSIIQFIGLLDKLDNDVLVNCFPFKHGEYQNGLLEIDYKKLQTNTNNCLDEKTRIVLAAMFNVNYNNWIKIFGDDFITLFEDCLINGLYELYGYSIEDYIRSLLSKNLINKSNMVDILVLRGIVLGQRYPDLISKKKLKIKILSNKLKIKLLSV